MLDFEISSLSGTGPATIRVKPKAANESESNKEQVIKVIVQGVEREVTFTQKGKPQVVETWKPFLTISPDSDSYTFDGTKRLEIWEVSVYSYEQKYIDGEPQEEYRALDWTVENSLDWLNITKEIGEGNNAGKLTVKTLSYNNEYEASTYNPKERSGVIRIVSQAGTKDITIKQSPGKRTTAYGFEPTPNIPFPGMGQGSSTASIRGVKGYQYYHINGHEVAKFIKQFKITDISKTIEGTIQPPGVAPGVDTFSKIPYKVWLTDYPSNISTTWVSELNCTGHLETRASMGGLVLMVTYNGIINDTGIHEVQLKIILGNN
nr:MAG: hypothetical protein [Bacteriophage sp.]